MTEEGKEVKWQPSIRESVPVLQKGLHSLISNSSHTEVLQCWVLQALSCQPFRVLPEQNFELTTRYPQLSWGSINYIIIGPRNNIFNQTSFLVGFHLPLDTLSNCVSFYRGSEQPPSHTSWQADKSADLQASLPHFQLSKPDFPGYESDHPVAASYLDKTWPSVHISSMAVSMALGPHISTAVAWTRIIIWV